MLDHRSASAHWGLESGDSGTTEIGVPAGCTSRLSGVIVRRRTLVLPREARRHLFIPVTSPALTLIDNSKRWGPERLEAMINAADGLGITDPDAVRACAERYPLIPGSSMVRAVLDRLTFELTDSELERMFRRLLRRAGLPQPLTQQWLGAYRVDFHWPDLGLIVEADSLRHHRTASEQARDRRRDQDHAVMGLQTIRFTHWQVAKEPVHVADTVAKVIAVRRGLGGPERSRP